MNYQLSSNLLTKVNARLIETAAGASWWGKLSAREKKAYITEHPGSKYAKDAIKEDKKKADTKSVSPAKKPAAKPAAKEDKKTAPKAGKSLHETAPDASSHPVLKKITPEVIKSLETKGANPHMTVGMKGAVSILTKAPSELRPSDLLSTLPPAGESGQSSPANLAKKTFKDNTALHDAMKAAETRAKKLAGTVYHDRSSSINKQGHELVEKLNNPKHMEKVRKALAKEFDSAEDVEWHMKNLEEKISRGQFTGPSGALSTLTMVDKDSAEAKEARELSWEHEDLLRLKRGFKL